MKRVIDLGQATSGQRRVSNGRKPGDWFRFAGRADSDPDTTVVHLYDEIGMSWFGGTSADVFVKELAGIDTPRIELHINSPGGDVFDGVAIYNALVQHPASVHVVVDGLAASAASFIATAGDRVSMGQATELMIHDAYTVTIGNEADHLDVARVLSQISGSIAALYADRAGGDAEQWRDAMRAETWYTAEEAVAAGLADEVMSRDGEPVDSAWLRGFRYRGRAHAPAPAPVDAGQQLDDAGGDSASDDAQDDAAQRLRDLLARADALIDGRDPDEVADPFVQARVEGRLAAHAELEQLRTR